GVEIQEIKLFHKQALLSTSFVINKLCHECFIHTSRTCNDSRVSVYYGRSSEHSVLGLLAGPSGDGPGEPLAPPEMAADVDAGCDAGRRRRPVVCAGSRHSALRRSATISGFAGVNFGRGSRRRAVPGTEAALSTETPLRARAPLLGGIAATRPILFSLRPH